MRIVFTAWKRFVKEESAQDLVEYHLVLAFVVVIAVALFQLSQSGVSAIWAVTNSNLNQGVQAAS